MVRARRAVRKPRKQKTEEYDSDDPNAYGDEKVPDKSSSSYIEDEIDQYHNAKISKLLAEGVEEDSNDEEMDEEEEVMPIQTQNDDSEEEEEDMESDLEAKNDDDLPNDMAWGNRKTQFYDTDYVSTKGKTREELEEEEQEEEGEAKNIQRRLAADLGEDDYDLNLLEEFVAEPEEEQAQPVEVKKRIGKDLVEMSQKQKLKLLKKESPELLELINDFKNKLRELKEEIQPLVEMVRDGRVPAGKGANYLLTKQQLYLHYCSNISFYLILKAKRIPAHNHPVIERLFTYRNLINKLADVDARLSPQFRRLLSEIEKPTLGAKAAYAAAKAQPEVQADDSADSSDSELDEEAALQFYRGLEQKLKRKKPTTAPPGEQTAEGEEAAFEEDAKRGITYQMAKNKGLTPKRKKIDRNPRVKHREKFRKAQIRRKGQVQQTHREMTRYSGELSGIRAGVKKSIKLK